MGFTYLNNISHLHADTSNTCLEIPLSLVGVKVCLKTVRYAGVQACNPCSVIRNLDVPYQFLLLTKCYIM